MWTKRELDWIERNKDLIEDGLTKDLYNAVSKLDDNTFAEKLMLSVACLSSPEKVEMVIISTPLVTKKRTMCLYINEFNFIFHGTTVDLDEVKKEAREVLGQELQGNELKSFCIDVLTERVSLAYGDSLYTIVKDLIDKKIIGIVETSCY